MAAWLEWCLLLPCCVASGLSTLTSPLSTIRSLSLSLWWHVVDATLAINPWSSSFGACMSGMVDGHHGMHQSVLHCGWCVGHLCVCGLSHGEHHVSSAMAHHALVVCV